MDTAQLTLNKQDIQKLLCSGNGDAALLYLYLQSGYDPEKAGDDLHLSPTHLSCASAMLRQLGLICDDRKVLEFSGERPRYSELDVMNAMDRDMDFRSLYGEVQRQLGRVLNTEELKILLGFTRYLGLPPDVIAMLVCYCKERARQKGNTRNPSLRTIEKEAYAWAEKGIDTMEEAAAFIQSQNVRYSRMGKLLQILQLHSRKLTPAEEKYAQSWLDMGFEEEAISMAYERTCLNTGGLSWPYMNKILLRWHEAGLLTAQQIRSGDRKPTGKNPSMELGDAELEAIQQLMKEG